MSQGPLLALKLAPPPLAAGLVRREPLLARLGQAGPGLLLVVAPAGFGKTTLLAQLLAGPAAPPAWAWLSIDERDNDPARFWVHLIAALERAAPGVGDHARSMLVAPNPAPIEVVVAALIEELGRAGGERLLILDDYQLIGSELVHAGVTALAEGLPPGTRLLIASRSEPPLPLARLRLRGRLLELRPADLRLSPAESLELLAAQGLRLRPADGAALAERAEGWAGALRLAALSLREAADPAALIAGFSGGHRHLFDYLAEEVLRLQPEPIQRFLLRSSILGQLCGELGDAVVGAGPAAALLEEVERRGLFLLPLDAERRWFRYHALFAEFLRARLARLAPAELPGLHRRAADWYAAAQMPAEAIGHLLEAGEAGRAAALIEQEGRPLLLRSEVATVLGWLAALPPGLARARPALSLIGAWAQAVAGQLGAAEALIDEASAALDAYRGDPDLPAEFSAPYTPRNLRSEALAVAATVAGLRREPGRAAELARQALTALPDDSVLVRGVVSLMLGNAAYQLGELADAAPALEAAAAAGEARGMPIIAIFALRQLGELHARAGQLHRGAATYQRAIELGSRLYPRRGPASDRPVPVAGAAYVGLGLIHYEWDQLERAAELLGAGLYLGRQGANVEILLMGPIGMARLQRARGDLAAARATIADALAFARATGVPRLAAWLAAEQARLALSMGEVGVAAAWDQERQLSPAGPFSYLEEIDYMALAQLRLAQGRPLDAIRLLARLRDLAEQQGRASSLVEILALSALAHRAAGDHARARAELRRALAIGEPEGFTRSLLDLGEPMALLLADLAAADQAAPGPRRLLDRYNAGRGLAAVAAAAGPRRGPIVPMASPPTARELEVLGLVAAGLTNEQIAERLVVGLSTVKKHINNLYAKLEVASRTQAIRRARELGLIE